MLVALKLNSRPLMEATFAACADPLEKKQLSYLLGSQGILLDLEDGPAKVEDSDLREELVKIASNSQLSEHYLALARDLDVMEPKTPDEVRSFETQRG